MEYMGGIFKRKIKNKKSKKSKEMPFLVCTVVFGASKEEEVLDASINVVGCNIGMWGF